MLAAIAEALKPLVDDDWRMRMDAWGVRVKLARDYAQGIHRAKMTEQMRKMLRISDTATEQFNANYCGMVVQTMADRLRVTKVEADSVEATTWAETLMDVNRFDGLQLDVYEAALRDGDTFLMVSYDNELQQTHLTHELAFDGSSGILPVYDVAWRRMIACAKVWKEGDTTRFNIYTPGMVRRFSLDGEDVAEMGAAEWVTRDGKPLGLPVKHFRHHVRAKSETGMGELEGVIGLQDALNRTIISMVMTAELTAFQIRIAKGFQPPATVEPGSWVVIGETGLSNEQVADATVLEQGQIVPFISQADFVINQIGTITRTPLPSSMGGAGESGEALKQREVGLISKVENAQTRLGNVWEDTFALARDVDATFSPASVPTAKVWRVKWKPAQTRTDTEIIAIAKQIREDINQREFLRLIASVVGYDEGKITQVVADTATERVDNIAALGANLLPSGEVPL